MDVEHHIRAGDVLQKLPGHELRHIPQIGAGEGAVHVQIKAGNAPLDGVDAQRIHRRVDFHAAVKLLFLPIQNLAEEKAHILPL